MGYSLDGRRNEAFWLHNSDNYRESSYDAEKTSHILSNIYSRNLRFTTARANNTSRFDLIFCFLTLLWMV